MKIEKKDGVYEVDTGGVWDFEEWQVELDELYYKEPRCKHAIPIEEDSPKAGWKVPFVAVVLNEGGYCSTGLCLECAAEALEKIKKTERPVCTCHERDNSYVCEYCYSQGYRGHMQK